MLLAAAAGQVMLLKMFISTHVLRVKKCIQVIKRLKKRGKEASSDGYSFHYCVSDSALEHLAFGSSSTEKKCFAEAVADGAQLEILSALLLSVQEQAHKQCRQ